MHIILHIYQNSVQHGMYLQLVGMFRICSRLFYQVTRIIKALNKYDPLLGQRKMPSILFMSCCTSLR